MLHLERPVGAGALLVTFASVSMTTALTFNILAHVAGGPTDYITPGQWTMYGITQDFDFDGTRPGVGRDTWTTRPTVDGTWGLVEKSARFGFVSQLPIAIPFPMGSDSFGWQGTYDISDIIGPCYGMMLCWIPPAIDTVTYNAFGADMSVDITKGGVLPKPF